MLQIRALFIVDFLDKRLREKTLIIQIKQKDVLSVAAAVTFLNNTNMEEIFFQCSKQFCFSYYSFK